MSYVLSITGHKDVADEDEARSFEESVAAAARSFVASLEGVDSANGSFGTIGAQDLKAAS